MLHVGDHDPSGVKIYDALVEDVTAFVEEIGGAVEFTRLAVTPKQIAALDLPTALAKKSSHSKGWVGRTAQCEAIPPDVLANIVREAIEDRLDMDAYKKAIKREEKVRKELLARLA